MTDVAFPFDIGIDGGTAAADARRHLSDLIVQILLTSPGERVMRPTFGAGISALLFEPTGEAIAATLQHTAHAALQRELGTRVEILGVTTEARDSTLIVTVRYRTGATAEEAIEIEVAA